MLMPFAMLYPPNMAALPHVAYPYPHFCNNPSPRFAETPMERAPCPPRRASSAFSTNSTTAPSTPRNRTWGKRPKTPHPSCEKKERSSISACMVLSLAGCAQYGAAFPIPGPAVNFTPQTPNTPSRVEQRQRSQAIVNPTNTRFTEHIEPKEAREKKRERLRNYGKKVGKWIAGVCWWDNAKQRYSRNELQPEEGNEKHAGAENTVRRKASSSSEVTLVETVGQPGEEILVRTRTRVSPARIYTGH